MKKEFKPYPKYRDSGTDWIGKIPEGWEVKPVFGFAHERKEKNTGMAENNLLSLSYGRIIRKDISSSEGLLPESFETYQIVRPGDIVFRLTDLQNDKRSLRSALVRETGIITSAYLAIKPAGVNSNFLNHLYRAYDTCKVFYSMGGGLRQSMKYDDMKRLPTLMPSAAEQEAIAGFLDAETAKIDETIRELDESIGLVNEERSNTIENLVYFGVRPDGKGPKKTQSDWKKVQLRHIANIRNGQVDPKDARFNKFPLIAGNHIESGTGRLIAVESAEEQSAVSGKYWVNKGEIIYSKIRPALNKAIIAPFDCLCSADAYPLICNPEKVRPNYLLYYILSRKFLEYAVLLSMRVAMPKINREDLLTTPIFLPSLQEQDRIVAAIENETGAVTPLIAEKQSLIESLREYRSTLIYEAVTGKIDLRDS